MPFGDEIGAGVGGRTETLKYSLSGSDNIRKRFTGYEKDDETGLDFAEARMYRNDHGRFTSPDPALSSMSALNPQTFNRYVYVGNNPVNITDPSGLKWCNSRMNGGAVHFAGAGVECDADEVSQTQATAQFNGIDANGVRFSNGDLVNLHEDGRITVVRPLNTQDVSDAGVRNSSDPGSTVTVDAPTGEVGSAITKRQAEPGPDLGCPAEAETRLTVRWLKGQARTKFLIRHRPLWMLHPRRKFP